jgi:hypothetical protein
LLEMLDRQAAGFAIEAVLDDLEQWLASTAT